MHFPLFLVYTEEYVFHIVTLRPEADGHIVAAFGLGRFHIVTRLIAEERAEIHDRRRIADLFNFSKRRPVQYSFRLILCLFSA